MATTIVSIGSNQAIDTETPATCGGAGPLYDVTWVGSVSASVYVGDIATATHFATASDYTYLITAIVGSTYTLKYITDSAATGDLSPCALCLDSYCDDPPVFTFKRAFTTIILFEVDVADATPLYWGTTDDVIGELHADSNFTDNTVTFDNKQSLASLTLSVNVDSRHDGTAESGALWKPTTQSGHSVGVCRVVMDGFTLEWIDMSLASLDLLNTNKAVVTSAANNLIIRNCLLHDKYGDPGGTGPFGIHEISTALSTDTQIIQNNIVYNFEETNNDSAGGIVANAFAGNLYIYNNTAYKIVGAGGNKHGIGYRFGNTASCNARIKNNIASACNGPNLDIAFWKNNASSTTTTANNLSDDTVNVLYDAEDMGQALNDTSAITGVTLAEIDFVSTTIGTEDLHLLSNTSVCWEAGVDLGSVSGVNIDIDGIDRDSTGAVWDIGADQASSVASNTNPAFIMFMDC